MGAAIRHDVFIVYSQAEPEPTKLVRALADGLLEIGFTLPGYEEMDWWMIPPGEERLPKSAEQMVNTPMLERYFDAASCVVVVAKAASAGVQVELDTLAGRSAPPPTLALRWPDAPPLPISPQPAHEISVDAWRGRDCVRHARELRAWAWLAASLIELQALGPIGTWVAADLVARHELAAKVVAASKRFAAPLQRVAQQRLRGASADSDDAIAWPPSLRVDTALPVWRYWRSGAALLARRAAKLADIGSELRLMGHRLDDCCDDLEARYPGALTLDAEAGLALARACDRCDEPEGVHGALDAVLSADALVPEHRFEAHMLRAKLHAEADDIEPALQDYAAALAALDGAGLPPVFATNVHVRRAECLIAVQRFDLAIADLDVVLTEDLQDDDYGRFSTHYLRGTAHFHAQSWQAAADDFSAVLNDQRAPQATQLSARLRRGVARERAGDRAGAERDYRAVLNDPRAAGNTHDVAQHNLDELDRSA